LVFLLANYTVADIDGFKVQYFTMKLISVSSIFVIMMVMMEAEYGSGCHIDGHFRSSVRGGKQTTSQQLRTKFEGLLASHGVSAAVIKCTLDKVAPLEKPRVFERVQFIRRNKRLTLTPHHAVNDEGCSRYPVLCEAAKTCYRESLDKQQKIKMKKQNKFERLRMRSSRGRR